MINFNCIAYQAQINCKLNYKCPEEKPAASGGGESAEGDEEGEEGDEGDEEEGDDGEPGVPGRKKR